jgi:hypothetical protein
MGYKPIQGYDFMSVPKTIEMVRLTNEDRLRFDRRSYHRPYEDQPFGILINGQLLCYHNSYMDQSRVIPTLYCTTEEGAIGVIRQFRKLNDEFPFSVCEFEYNGFFGKATRERLMSYRARFTKWSGDPGIAKMACSDGQERYIPTYAMPHSFACLPNDMTRVENDGGAMLFGAPSKS